MCHLCRTGVLIAHKVKDIGYSPEDALHILSSAVADIVRSAEWQESLNDVVAAIAQQIRDGMNAEALH